MPSNEKNLQNKDEEKVLTWPDNFTQLLSEGLSEVIWSG